MIKVARVLAPPAGDRPGQLLLATLDVSGEADGGAQTMADLKVTYGVGATYLWHNFRHDEGRLCTVEPA